MIIDKVRKLLALGTSDNIYEAEAAMAAAEWLITKHNLSVAELQTAPLQTPTEASDPLIVYGKTRPLWQRALANVIAKHHSCVVLGTYSPIHRTQVETIIGTQSNVDLVRYLYAYLTVEIERLTQKLAPKGKSARNSYRMGAVSGISEAMKAGAQAARTHATSTALARVDQGMDASKLVMSKLYPNVRAGARASIRDGSAYEQGKHDAAHLGNQSKQIGSTTRQLKA